MSNRASKVVEKAKAWLGRNEAAGTHKAIVDVYNAHKPLARGYAVKYTDSWCATFVSAVAIKADCTDVIPLECSCQQQIELFKKLCSWVENDSYVPKAGDIVYYDWNDTGKGDNAGWSDHVGIVEKVSGNNITVIEGNYHDSVKRRIIAVNAKNIRGYGVPKYGDTTSQTKLLTSANDIAWELNHSYFPITEMERFVKALEEAKQNSSSLYWGYYKLVNKIK